MKTDGKSLFHFLCDVSKAIAYLDGEKPRSGEGKGHLLASGTVEKDVFMPGGKLRAADDPILLIDSADPDLFVERFQEGIESQRLVSPESTILKNFPVGTGEVQIMGQNFFLFRGLLL